MYRTMLEMKKQINSNVEIITEMESTFKNFINFDTVNRKVKIGKETISNIVENFGSTETKALYKALENLKNVNITLTETVTLLGKLGSDGYE